MRVEDLNGSRILQWNPANDDKGKIINYKLLITPIGYDQANLQKPSELNLNADISLFDLRELYYCRNYTATISAFTYLGEGPSISTTFKMGLPRFGLFIKKGNHTEHIFCFSHNSIINHLKFSFIFCFKGS